MSKPLILLGRGGSGAYPGSNGHKAGNNPGWGDSPSHTYGQCSHSNQHVFGRGVYLGGEPGSQRGEATVLTTAPPCPPAMKNFFQFKESSHLGDSDYEVAEEVDHGVDKRPECPYGTSCYRKNRLHKKMYKHTAEEYAESDNSFIDDESQSSANDDSEYLPSESDESVNTKKEKAALLALLKK
ncbi:aprataxin and PNK-like factor [Brienomyrus brachyistius]|uniref:aprataxin and PNK-like factor n=1 Tax=Brienomyrus brachyistius TaxID=42636 RepID=UPI0020B1B0B7|nr:aprataxin and PNK-like factor [Brienomyrus brachyistius]